MASLPKSFNLAEPIPSLPDGATSQLITCRPISGGTFNQQAVIEVDLGNRGWLLPQSLSIRYKVSNTVGAGGSAMVGVPLYTPFTRLSLLIGGGNLETISQWNQCAQVLVNGQYSVAGKYGLAPAFGYNIPNDASGNSTGNLEYMDGRADPSGNNTYTVAGPLIGSVFANSEKALPLFAMPQVRFQFTLDSIANMYFVSAVTTQSAAFALPSAFAISNFELCYQMVDMGSGVEKMVYDMGRQISIKTHGTANSAIAVPSATSGSQSYVFNQRFASIRSAFICPNRADGSGNRWAEIVDLTTNNGDYQLQIGNQAFPQMPLSTALNESGILQETRRAFGNLYDSNNAMAINAVEFAKNINDAASTLTYYAPGKHIVGINLEKVQTDDHVLMSGASTYNTPISCVINCGTATTVAANLNLILDYDAVLVLDPVARQLSLRA
jgi:hypothetical protein